MSPRAAWRLESLGFGDIHDYMAGQADWLAFALPVEGKQAGKPRAGGIARRDVPTCQITDRLSEVQAKLAASEWESCIVVDEHSIVLGRIRGDAFDADPRKTAEEVMEPGPSTVRPSEYLDALVKRMKKPDVKTILVTTSIGELLGVLRREDAEERLAEDQKSA